MAVLKGIKHFLSKIRHYLYERKNEKDLQVFPLSNQPIKIFWISEDHRPTLGCSQ